MLWGCIFSGILRRVWCTVMSTKFSVTDKVFGGRAAGRHASTEKGGGLACVVLGEASAHTAPNLCCSSVSRDTSESAFRGGLPESTQSPPSDSLHRLPLNLRTIFVTTAKQDEPSASCAPPGGGRKRTRRQSPVNGGDHPEGHGEGGHLRPPLRRFRQVGVRILFIFCSIVVDCGCILLFS